MKQSLTSMTKGPGSTQTKFQDSWSSTEIPHIAQLVNPCSTLYGTKSPYKTRSHETRPPKARSLQARATSQSKVQRYVVKYVNYMSVKQWVQKITEGRRSGYQESSMLGQVLYHIKSKLQRMWSGGNTDQLLPSNIRTDTTDSKEAPELPATTYESGTTRSKKWQPVIATSVVPTRPEHFWITTNTYKTLSSSDKTRTRKTILYKSRKVKTIAISNYLL